MKSGKVSQAVLSRSVLRPLTLAHAAGTEAAFGEDCTFLPETSRENRVASASVCGTVGGRFDRPIEMLLAGVMNNLSTAGAGTEEILLNILFPADWEEAALKRLMQQAAAWCSTHGITVAGGHTEVSPAVVRPVVSVTGFGRCGNDKGRQITAGESEYSESRQTTAGESEYPESWQTTAGLGPEEDLVMTGFCGLAGTAILAKQERESLLERYPFSLVDTAERFETSILIQEAALTGICFGVSAMHDVSQGGVFGALWEMAERAGTGLDVDLKKIPIRQETVEICEFFDVNPYLLYGQGALLLGTRRGEALVSELRARGIPAAVIGRTTDGNDRVIRNGEETRFLDRPAQDELWRLAESRENGRS